MKLNELALIGVATATVVSCAPAKNEYASYELYPVRSGSLTEMEYTPEVTNFTLWAPTADEVRLMLFDAGDGGHAYETVSMVSDKEGTWTAKVEKDLIGKFYTFNVKIKDKWLGDTPGINAKAVGVNGKRAAIIDMRATDPEGWAQDKRPALASPADAVIYEMHHRDFSIDPSSGIQHKGKFLALTEEGTLSPEKLATGIDHLKELGVTHVHILPSYDYASVDETKLDENKYNWGYDPAQYNVPEGSYCTDPNDGYSRIVECKQMIADLHAKGIRVVMDVVYNHMYDVNASAFERIVPGYYFRKNPDGSLSNGSWCGNDLDSGEHMVRKYIIDMSRRWQSFYGVDGYRFDLMGIIDIETINRVYQICSAYDASFMVYGEGWNMPTNLPDEQKAMQDNHAKMPKISFFNDEYREVIKGFITGNLYETEKARNVITATNRYTSPDQSINYVECHDNATVFDKLYISNVEEGLDGIITRQKNLTIMVLLSQGIPFIHAGQEFYRTKGGIGNTYNSPDNINCINWDFRDIYKDDINEIRKIIQLRKDNKCFRYATRKEIEANVMVENIDFKMLKYTLKQDEGEYREFVIYINPSSFTFDYEETAYQHLYGEITDQQIGARTIVVLAR